MSHISPQGSHVAEIAGEKDDNVILGATDDQNDDTSSGEDKSVYLHGWALKSLAMALMSAGFMLSLDDTILATAIPRITSDFNSLNDIGWYGASYLVTQMSLLPTCGRIYTFYDVKWSYMVLMLIFELGSIICAVSQNSMTLIVGRAVSGLGAAGLLGGAAILVSYCVELRQRPLLMGLITAVYGLGSMMGPLVGGVITDNEKLTWRFCFWVNLPFGAIGLVQIWFALKNPPPAAKGGLPPMQKIRQLDLPGATVLIGSIVCLLLALQWGGIVYPWSNAKVYGCLIGFGLILILFIVMQIKDQNSCTIPLHLFRNRTTYYWPIYFQSVKGHTAKDSGVQMLPLCISSSLSALTTGLIISKIGYYVPFMWIGAPVLSLGAGLFQLIHTHSPISTWIGYQLVSGIGYGICGQLPILAVQIVLDKEDVPTGCVLVMFFQCLGGALATSIGQNLFTDNLLKNLRSINGVDAEAVVDAGAADFRRLVSSELLDSVIEAFEAAVKNVFLLAVATAAVALVVSVGMEWRRLPKDTKSDTGSETA
ncbi:MFS toxin transporter [Penicillium paradoxum]|uniref:MFS toxin transporter n=1 Tax=Penicillium paradoxum TaxID=176176 RepID=UPI0025477FA1|nr:MFS toxin transporter [Penicillium paradoxum]KAJ5773649.1 MFS toxin transporter [Penicillium paradoxum]